MQYNVQIEIGGLKLPYGLTLEAHSLDEAQEKAKLNFIPTFKIYEKDNKQATAGTSGKKMEEEGNW